MSLKPFPKKKDETAVANRKKLEAVVSRSDNLWGYTELGKEALKASMTMISTKHGLYANIPIICKAENCPYADTCRLVEFNLAPLSEMCPLEVAQIKARYEAYSQDFDLASGSFTDQVVVSDLIETDILMDRCKKLIQSEVIPISDSIVNITEDGTPIYEKKVSPTIELNERLSKKRANLFNLMKATRKDKKDETNDSVSVSDIFSQIVEMETEGVGFIEDEVPERLKEEYEKGE